MKRRRRIRAYLLAAIVGTTAWMLIDRPMPVARGDTPHAADATPIIAPEEAMRRLAQGNERFVEQKATKEHQDAARRDEVAKGQHPFAIVLGCADSRVPPEVVFDQGLGDLFVIRVAGEVAPAEVIGSIEYAVDHLGCRTIVVLGHSKCGAVDAALHASGTPEGNIGELLKDIVPAVKEVDRNAPDALDTAVRANAKAVAQTLVDRSKMLAEMSKKGELKITPARYDLDSGKVEYLDH